MSLSGEVLRELLKNGLLSKHLLELAHRCPTFAFFYARVLKARWPEAEPYIMKIPEEAYWYARLIIHGPWLEAEPFLANSDNSEWPYRYALFVLKLDDGLDAIKWAERWRRAHPDQDKSKELPF